MAEFISRHDIKVASLTDHNTVYGQEEFRRACAKYKIKAIPGIEIYVKFKNRKKMNILWYNYDCSDTNLCNIISEIQVRRRAKVRGHLELLERRGFKLNINKIIDKHQNYIPINHVIDDIIATPKNLAKIRRETGEKNPREYQIIHEYFYNSKMPHMMHESYVNVERIIELRKKAGGQIILNHPGKRNQLKPEFLKQLKKIGVDGLEVLSPHHSIRATMYAQFIAQELDFIATGSSDFHRFEGNRYPIQSSFNYFRVESKMLRGVHKIIG